MRGAEHKVLLSNAEGTREAAIPLFRLTMEGASATKGPLPAQSEGGYLPGTAPPFKNDLSLGFRGFGTWWEWCSLRGGHGAHEGGAAHRGA
jgi:hypothetical protein